MPSLQSLLDSYGQYHSDRRNQLIHLIGIPVVTFSLFILLGWFRFVILDGISVGILFFIGMLIYYLTIDRKLTLWVAALFSPLLFFAEYLIVRNPVGSITWFGLSFVVGWALQLLGHAFEGRKPALIDNFLQVFVAPLFVAHEIRERYFRSSSSNQKI